MGTPRPAFQCLYQRVGQTTRFPQPAGKVCKLGRVRENAKEQKVSSFFERRILDKVKDIITSIYQLAIFAIDRTDLCICNFDISEAYIPRIHLSSEPHTFFFFLPSFRPVSILK